MNTIFNSRRVGRVMLCAVIAAVITAVGGWGFVQSTEHGPGVHIAVPSVASLKIPLEHSVFGRPEPAVLVD
jgi:hypothetical protein